MTPSHQAAEDTADSCQPVDRSYCVAIRRASVVCALLTLFLACALPAAVPQLLRTPGFEAPVHGDPDDLLLLPGWGFEAGDRVVYRQERGGSRPDVHPETPAAKSTEISGTAPIVQAGEHALIVRLPAVLQPRRIYSLWVVSPSGTWSEPVRINDPRPMWFTPTRVQAVKDFGDLGRRMRVIGRNLAPASGGSVRIRLTGPSTYELTPTSSSEGDMALEDFVAEASLPARLAPGSYTVSLNRDGLGWVSLLDQKLEVQPDGPVLETFSLGDPRFGECEPDDGRDDADCLRRAIDAARAVGQGIIVVPAGTWDIFVARDGKATGFQLPSNVHLRGEEAPRSILVRHGARHIRRPGALLTLTGFNSITHLTFADEGEYQSIDESRPIIQLGTTPAGPNDDAWVEDIVISNNSFDHVGRAIVDAARSIRHLIITHDLFESYDNSIYISGARSRVSQPFRLEDAIIRWNRFAPGSYPRGSIASQLGASRRVDFSSNLADGRLAPGAHEEEVGPGWAAAFFWNVLGPAEEILVSGNRIFCPGEAGNGEAIAYDDNGDTAAFAAAQTVAAAGRDSVTVPGPVLDEQFGVKIPLASYYREHWIQVVQGPGLGQTRRITSYRLDPRSRGVTFQVSPPWDVIPMPRVSRIGAGRQFWQTYTVANYIDQSAPGCRKGNRTGPVGGQITQWGQAADTTIAGNRQIETSGIVLQQVYSVKAPSCPTCERVSMFQSSTEIERNQIEGEYLWDSDCSESGIMALFGASDTPESPPPLVSFGLSIAHNVVGHADGFRGGAIDITTSWSDGPPPHDWPLVESPLIFHNVVRDIAGSLPAPLCRRPMAERVGIRIGEGIHVRNAMAYKNKCTNVDVPMFKDGTRMPLECGATTTSDCECGARR